MLKQFNNALISEAVSDEIRRKLVWFCVKLCIKDNWCCLLKCFSLLYLSLTSSHSSKSIKYSTFSCLPKLENNVIYSVTVLLDWIVFKDTVSFLCDTLNILLTL